MVQCEMCGTETSSPNRVKVEGAELDVCDSCTDFGTEVQTGDSSSSTSTKYSTSSSSSSSGDSGSGSSGRSGSAGSSGGGGGGRSDMFDDIEELAQDYDERIRQGREAAGLSLEDLADELNLKASHIRKLEHGDTLPSDEVQRKLESKLDVELSAGAGGGDTEWEGGGGAGETTLGDVVERKD